MLDASVAWEIWESLQDFIIVKEKEDAIESVLQVFYNNDCDMIELKDYADDNDDIQLSKQLKIFIRDYDLGE